MSRRDKMERGGDVLRRSDESCYEGGHLSDRNIMVFLRVNRRQPKDLHNAPMDT